MVLLRQKISHQPFQETGRKNLEKRKLEKSRSKLVKHTVGLLVNRALSHIANSYNTNL